MPIPPTYDFQFVQDVDGQMTLRLTDTTPWVANGYTLTTVDIFIGIESPDGQAWHPINLSLPDIDPSVTLVFEMPAPNDSQGDPMAGDYIVTYRAYSSIGPTTFGPVTATHTLCDDCPPVCVNAVTDCIYMFATVSDDTAWASNGYTVDSREFTLYYPQGSGISPYTSNAGFFDTPGTGLWTGTYTVNYTVTVTKGAFTGTYYARKEFKAECPDYGLCSMVCCLNSAYDMIKGPNGDVNSLWQAKFDQMVDLLTYIRAVASCGQGSLVGELTQAFYRIGNCNSKCACGCEPDSGPTLMVPIHPGNQGGAGTTYTFVNGPGIAVITIVAGVVTISVLPSLLATIASLYNTVVTSTGGTVTVTSSTTGITTTYNLAVAKPVYDNIRFKVRFDSVGLGWHVSDVRIQGTKFNNGPIAIATNIANFIDRITGFCVADPTPYTVNSEVTGFAIQSAYSNVYRQYSFALPRLVHNSASTEALDVMFMLTCGMPGLSGGSAYNWVTMGQFLSYLDAEFTITALNL